MDSNDEIATEVRSILSAARERGRGDGRPLTVDARRLGPALAAAESDGRIPIIAEVKPTSPTTDAHRDEDPVRLARDMVAGGAAALSVLTEPDHFDGSPEALRSVRNAVDVPVLRKDFILYEEQLDVVAADTILLIARFIEDLDDLLTAARKRGFQAVVEVHTVAELEQAIKAGADIVGVNNRDLASLEVDLGTFERIAPTVPDDIILLAESGISTPADARRMRAAGADGLLVGSAIMEGNVTANTQRLTDLREARR